MSSWAIVNRAAASRAFGNRAIANRTRAASRALASWVIGGLALGSVAWTSPAAAIEPEAVEAAAEAAASRPFVLVLGTAQDGGIPHLGGHAAPDLAARRDPALRRLVASLLVVDPASGRRFLIDASPDLTIQLDRAAAVLDRTAAVPERSPSASGAPRPRLLDAVFLTHAHIGHYLGLAQFGREVAATDRLPVWGSARMHGFLTTNAPWEQLVRLRQIELRLLRPGEPVELAPGLSLTPLLVPHRDEYTDTFGFVLRGPRRALFYLPDIDKWERWSTRIEDLLATVDVALLDATFFGDGELPGRAIAEVPHPFVVESLARFAPLPATERAKVVFTHLNHTNPAALADTPERRAIEAAGMRVAEEMERFDL
jgi:pyrroloquinoline quinone biosynthesis protein B